MIKDRLKTKIGDMYPDVGFDILTPPNLEMGDYSINLPFILAKKEKKNPVELGKKITGEISADKDLKKYFKKIEFAPPGFINLHLSEDFLGKELGEILKKKDKYGSGEDKKININIEFVSANPTGPLTVGNARAGSYGDTLANILKKAGFKATREYYINDVGKQVEKLGKSIINEANRIVNRTLTFKEEGLYTVGVEDVAKEVMARLKKKNLDEGDLADAQKMGMEINLDKIKKSAKELDIDFDTWFHESDLHKSGEVDETLKLLKDKKGTFEKEGALWLKFGEKENDVAVLIKSDGAKTYLMNDIAYTRNKFSRGFTKAINIWGTDHHGDVPRLKGGVSLLGLGGELEILLHQLVSVKKGGESVRMSKRAGNIEKLDDLVAEAGKDSTRFFFLAKDLNTHMEFDIDLAKEQSKKNPVFYIQYAYARLNQISAKAGIDYDDLNTEDGTELMKEKEEWALIRKMAKFPELVEEIAANYQVHHLGQYAYELASDFHNFYEKHHVVQDNKELQETRLKLCSGVKIVLGLCLDLMGLTAPEKM